MPTIQRRAFRRNRLREVRLKAGLSQTDLAAKVGRLPSHLNAIENNPEPGGLRLGTCQQIAIVLKVKLEAIWPTVKP